MSKKSNWGRILLSGASLAAMGALASPALAQDADEVTDEIVVTATGPGGTETREFTAELKSGGHSVLDVTTLR